MYFYAYIAVACFVLMNLVTAVIVENAMSASQHDSEQAMKEKEAERSKELKHLEVLFRRMDTDGGGTLCWDEFKSSFSDPEMQKVWSMMDCRPEDCKELFELLDDGSGEIDSEEFFQGLRRMRGGATAKDIFRIQKTICQMATALGQVQEQVCVLGSEFHGSPCRASPKSPWKARRPNSRKGTHDSQISESKKDAATDAGRASLPQP
mmetsp:Transcript_22106/g.55313  ORF Transcript_22106/g.55313 Transcript_22106/m.55313 type:complete len:207 (+) Transcript_22106:2-622(+)